jgi:predicted MFS family arabinose efflux permease
MRGIVSNKMLRNSNAIKALTLTDFSVWSGSSLIAVVFPLFVIQYIDGATLTDAGISSMIYTSIAAFMNIPLGKFMDSKKGLVDELYILSASNFIRGVALIAMAFISNLWVFYALQAVLGIAKSMNTTSWRILFSKFLDTKHLGKEWGIYDTIMSIGLGIAAFLGGYIGENVTFQAVILIGGVMSLIGTIFPLLRYKEIKAAE